MSKGKTGFRKDVFQKQVKSGPSTERKTYGSEFYSLPLDVEPSDKGRLEKFCVQETSYFNHLVEGFSSRVRSVPEWLLEFDEGWAKVLGAVAAEGKGVRPLIKSVEFVELPKALEAYKSLLLGVDVQGKRLLTERKLLILELTTAPGVLLPIVRKNMVLEILKHYKEQASRVLTPVPKRLNEDDEMSFKIAPEMLEVVEIGRAHV